jgi:hypothetical protein
MNIGAILNRQSSEVPATAGSRFESHALSDLGGAARGLLGFLASVGVVYKSEGLRHAFLRMRKFLLRSLQALTTLL